MQNKKIAIIGSGISGLAIARKLNQENQVTIFEKSRGVGGRMATRRSEKFHFDHGTQFFTAKNPEFREICKQAKAANAIDLWDATFAEIVGNKINHTWKFNNHLKLHYVGTPQMNDFCKFLAKDLDVKLNEEIINISFENKKWFLKTKDNNFDDFDFLIIAIPSTQAVKLVPPNFKYLRILENIKMLPCFSMMIGLKEKLDLEFDAALVKESIISWISVNNTKIGRPDNFSLLVNSGNWWAKDNLEDDIEIIKFKLINELHKIITFDNDLIEYIDIHRWRYANAPFKVRQKSLFHRDLHLGICGDYFISGRVENAFLSSMDLYHKIK
jgi:renalase